MILTIQQILDSFEKDPRFTGKPPERFTKVLGGLAPEDELIRKELPARLLRFEEGENAIVGAISDIRKDRDDEVLLSDGMDDSNFSGIVLYQHDYWRRGVPHARSLYREKLPKGNPYQIIAKTAYNVEVSDLGREVYEYRKREYPLGQSVGFKSIESVRREQTGYEDVYKAWLPRVKAMYKELGIRAGKDDFTEPYRFYTTWELWEYSDVFVPSNVGAVQYAVSKGIISPEEAKIFVSFELEDYVEKPYKNEHACRLEEPGQFDKIRRVNCDQKHDDKCIDVLYGIKDGKSKIQALRYPIKNWTEAAAKAHCKTRDGTFEAAAKGTNMELLEQRVAELEEMLEKVGGSPIRPFAQLEDMWDKSKEPLDLAAMWDSE